MPRPSSTLRKRIKRGSLSDRGIYGVATKLASDYGGAQRLDFGKGDIFKQGVGEVGLELGRQTEGNAPGRRSKLLQSVLRRKTGTSRQRALNRLLSGYGLTTGSSGTKTRVRR